MTQRHKMTVLTLEFCSFLGAYGGSYFPYTRSSPNNTPQIEQHIVWNLFQHGHGFLITTIKPGHVNLFRHLDIISPKHDIRLAKNSYCILSFHSSNISKPPRTNPFKPDDHYLCISMPQAFFETIKADFNELVMM